MSIIIGENSLIQFGQEINSQIDTIQGEDITLTKELLEKTYPMNLMVKLVNGSQDLQLKMRYHFCQPLHVKVTKTEYDAFIQREGYQDDMRVFFVKDEKEEQ